MIIMGRIVVYEIIFFFFVLFDSSFATRYRFFARFTDKEGKEEEEAEAAIN
jgi:hypothetical protein